MEFSSMSMSSLVSYYNQHSSAPVKRFSDRKAAERRCKAITPAKPQPVVETTDDTTGRTAMKGSLKLDRTIRCVNTGTTWDNAHQMWKVHMDWMTTGQQDRLTSQLYSAAKQGVRKQVTINGRTFELVNVIGEK